MSNRVKTVAFSLVLACIVSANTGCVTQQGPFLGVFGIPIPVSPYFQKIKEDHHWEHERYERSPILGPLTEDGPDIGMDEPSDDQVMRALERAHPVQGGFPWLYEIQRNNVSIVKEPISDYIDPPRVYPLIGPAQLHHVHYKCTVYYSQVTRIGWPLPHTVRDDDAAEVIYIDKTHLHMVGNVDTGVGSNY